MTELLALRCDPADLESSALQLEQALNRQAWVQLLPPVGAGRVISSDLLPQGSGFVIASGGSSGGRQHCLLPCNHLDQSAWATGEWLQSQGMELPQCLLLNPLPLHHVSGLMPWWRSRCWGAAHAWLRPALMRDPASLESWCRLLPGWGEQAVLLSLVPTQLQRLMDHAAGVRFLKACALIWVGGAALAPTLAEAARAEGLRLAPCYGATETAAMVTALTPERFLSGDLSCGSPLQDVELQLSEAGGLQVRTPRLAVSRWREQEQRLEVLVDADGWWHSGDAADLIEEGLNLQLKIVGRLDGAIHSGGETVFPDQVQQTLMELVHQAGLPLVELMVLAEPDPLWGDRLVALVRLEHGEKLSTHEKLLNQLAKQLQPCQRPQRWIDCPELVRNEAGKFQRSQWRKWLSPPESG